jgi:recombinational DNA repair protein RecT
VKHKPAFKYEGSIERMQAAWAMAHLPGGEKAVGVASKQRIENARKAGDPKSFAWPKFADAMARKTAIRDLAKFLPVALELQYAIGVDEQEEVKALRAAQPRDAQQAALEAAGKETP